MLAKLISLFKGKRIVEVDGTFVPQILLNSGWHAIPRKVCYLYENDTNPYGVIACGSIDAPLNINHATEYCVTATIEEAAESYHKYLDFCKARIPTKPKIHKMPRAEPTAWRKLKETNV
jgi:hypothetical protein